MQLFQLYIQDLSIIEYRPTLAQYPDMTLQPVPSLNDHRQTNDIPAPPTQRPQPRTLLSLNRNVCNSIGQSCKRICSHQPIQCRRRNTCVESKELECCQPNPITPPSPSVGSRIHKHLYLRVTYCARNKNRVPLNTILMCSLPPLYHGQLPSSQFPILNHFLTILFHVFSRSRVVIEFVIIFDEAS